MRLLRNGKRGGVVLTDDDFAKAIVIVGSKVPPETYKEGSDFRELVCRCKNIVDTGADIWIRW